MKVRRHRDCYNKLPDPPSGGPGLVMMALACFVLLGCAHGSSNDLTCAVVGVAKCRDQTASAKDRSVFFAEANALRLLQLCAGGEFLVEIQANGSASATLKSKSTLRGFSFSKIQGAEGYAFVKYDAPKPDDVPDKYRDGRCESLKLSGDAEQIIQMIVSHVAEYGGKVLKEKQGLAGAFYVRVDTPSFMIDVTPPQCRLKLQIWSDE